MNLLYDAGFLKVRREGLWAYYSMDKSSLPNYLSHPLNAVELRLTDNELASLDRERLKEAQRLGPQCCNPVAAEQTTA